MIHNLEDSVINNLLLRAIFTIISLIIQQKILLVLSILLI